MGGWSSYHPQGQHHLHGDLPEPDEESKHPTQCMIVFISSKYLASRIFNGPNLLLALDTGAYWARQYNRGCHQAVPDSGASLLRKFRWSL